MHTSKISRENEYQTNTNDAHGICGPNYAMDEKYSEKCRKRISRFLWFILFKFPQLVKNKTDTIFGGETILHSAHIKIYLSKAEGTICARDWNSIWPNEWEENKPIADLFLAASIHFWKVALMSNQNHNQQIDLASNFLWRHFDIHTKIKFQKRWKYSNTFQFNRMDFPNDYYYQIIDDFPKWYCLIEWKCALFLYYELLKYARPSNPTRKSNSTN